MTPSILTIPLLFCALTAWTQEVELLSFRVAGVQYTEQHLVPEGAELQVIAEPANEYDRYAVRLEYEGVRVGYLPAAHNRIPHNLLSQGVQLRCKVVQFNPTAEPWFRIRAQLSMEQQFNRNWAAVQRSP